MNTHNIKLSFTQEEELEQDNLLLEMSAVKVVIQNLSDQIQSIRQDINLINNNNDNTNNDNTNKINVIEKNVNQLMAWAKNLSEI